MTAPNAPSNALIETLQSLGPLTTEALATATRKGSAGCVLDCPHVDAPLLISFGPVEWDGLASFDFFGRSKKFEARYKVALNRILLRDIGSLWYQHGVAGLGSSAAELTRSLALLIYRLAPTRVILVGQSMGGYAALQFATSLKQRGINARALAFGPLSYLDAKRAREDGERRFPSPMACLEARQPAGFVPDLAEYIREAGGLDHSRIIIGTAEGPPDGDNLDDLHGERFARIAGIEVVRFPHAPHAVIEWLKARRQIDALFEAEMISLLQDDTRDDMTASDEPGLQVHLEIDSAPDGSRFAAVRIEGFPNRQPIGADWQQWIAESLMVGSTRLDLLYTMVKAGFDAADSRNAILELADSPALAAGKRLVSRVAKRDWVLACQAKSAALDPATHQIPICPTLDRETFLREHYARGRPVVMKGAFDDWPALKKWNLDYLNQVCGGREIQVQTGRDNNAQYETQAQQHRTLMPMSDFLAWLAAIEASGGTSNDLYMTAGNTGINDEALTDLWPDTRPAISTYLNPELPQKNGFLWLGPPGTVTPLHHDLTNNFMAQVLGRKRVLLIDPALTPRLYNHVYCYSEVDLRNVDLARFPLMDGVPVMEHILEPGDLLFIPIGWWHQVMGLDTSITITFTNFHWPNDYSSFYRAYGPV